MSVKNSQMSCLVRARETSVLAQLPSLEKKSFPATSQYPISQRRLQIYKPYGVGIISAAYSIFHTLSNYYFPTRVSIHNIIISCSLRFGSGKDGASALLRYSILLPAQAHKKHPPATKLLAGTFIHYL